MMKKNSIVIITECPYSGILRAIIEHSKFFRMRNFNITFIVPSIPRDRYGECQKDNILALQEYGTIITTPLRRKYHALLSDKHNLEKVLYNFPNSIIFSYTGYAGKLCRLLYREQKIPLLYHVPQCIDIRRRPLWQRPIEYFFEKCLAPYASFYIACSESECHVLREEFNIQDSRVIIIPNSIQRTIVSVNREKKYEFVILGRITKDKGIESILTVAKKLQLLEKTIIIGDGGLLKKLRKNFTKTIFTGHISNDEVLGYLAHARFIISNSIIEGLPFALIEAMSQGVVPIVSSIPSHRDLVTDGTNGFLFHDTLELAGLLSQMSNITDNLYQEYSRRAIEKVAFLKNQALNNFIFHFQRYG